MATELAGRGTRLGASVIDALLCSLWMVTGYFGAIKPGHDGDWASMLTDPQSVPFFAPPTKGIMPLLLLGVLLTLILLLVQILWLSTRGQTVGKRLLGIKIVRTDGKNGGFVSNVLLRSLAPQLIYFIPLLTLFFSASSLVILVVSLACRLAYPLADILLIFSKDRRCIHDHIAGTQVVKA